MATLLDLATLSSTVYDAAAVTDSTHFGKWHVISAQDDAIAFAKKVAEKYQGASIIEAGHSLSLAVSRRPRFPILSTMRCSLVDRSA